MLHISEVPDYIEPIRGYRCWIFRSGDSVLRSTQYRWSTWNPKHRKASKCACQMGLTMRKYRTLDRSTWVGARYPKKYFTVLPRTHTGKSSWESNWDHSGHSCGIYAASSLENLCRWFTRVISLSDNSYIVFGEVDLWGKIITHELGYRAQYARIKTLYKFDSPSPVFSVAPVRISNDYVREIHKYSRIYKVPVQVIPVPRFWEVLSESLYDMEEVIKRAGFIPLREEASGYPI